MKVLFVSDLYPPIWVGGYEVNCAEMARGLADRGHEVHVLTSAYSAEQITERQDRVYRRLLFNANWIPPQAPGATGIGRNRLVVQWHNVRAVRDVIDQIAPQVVVFWGCHHLGRALLSAAEERARVVYWLADPWLTLELALETREWRYRWPRRLYDAGLRLLGIPSGKVRRNHLIFVSRALRAEYVRLGARVGQGTIIYPGIPAELAQFQPPHILSRDPSEPPRILYFGAISAFKGVMTLVDALETLRRIPDLADTRLTLLGNVHQEEFGVALRRRIRDLGLQDAVELVPRCPRSELPAVFRRHDVQAFTSEGVEAYSLSLLEGMAAGLPVVSSLCGGSAEILRDGVNGRTFRAGDAGDLAAKLAWLLQHPEEAARLGRAASAEVRQRGTLRSQVDALEAYLQNVVAGRPAGPLAPSHAGKAEDGAPRERAGTYAG